MNLFLVAAWLVFSFLFWRGLRRWAVEEDRIFDLTFYAGIVAVIGARLGYVLANSDAFVGKSLLLVPALWILPGLSWLGGLTGGIATLVVLSRFYKVRLGLVLDSLALSLPLPVIIGLVGSLLTQEGLGKPAVIPWAIRTGSQAVSRHPVQFYEMVVMLILSVVVIRLTAISARRKWPYGLVGVWFILLYAVSVFILEFVKDTRVYWGGLTANQWVLIGIFAECIGVLYIRGGGREKTRPWVLRMTGAVGRFRKGMYEFISKRHARRAE